MHNEASLIDWGNRHDDVRALILTGSLASPAPYIDALSDFDLILILRDMRPYWERRAWLDEFDTVLAAYRDPINLEAGFETSGYVVQFVSGLKIDFTLWSVAYMQHLAAAPGLTPEFDAGYRVLLDKDGLTSTLKPASFKGYIPEPPTDALYHEKIENFFLDTTYVAKFLWRDDLVAAREVLHHYMLQENVIPMLEWRSEFEHNWTIKPGPIGRRLKRWIAPDLWDALAKTYVSADLEANWQALADMMVLMRRVSVEVGDRLGYAYPHAMDARAAAYVHKIRAMPRP